MAGQDDLDLDALFATARRAAPAPSDGLFDRVLADARTHQPQARPLRTAAPAPRRGMWSMLSALFGGGGVLAGMGSAMVAGLALGLLQPAPVSALTTAIFDDSAVAVDLMPAYSTMIEEAAADE
ncbi:MAG: dihydroorotate dehydrogenase [Paracoccaceae bacterium]